MPTPREEYIAQLNATIARYAQVEDDAARRIAELLRQTRLEINAQIQTASTSGQIQLRALQANIEALLANFEAQAAGELDTAVRAAFTVGGQSAVAPLQALGVPGVAYWQPSAATLNTLVDFDAALVKGISNDVRQVVNRQIQQAALQQITPFQAMQNLTAEFGSVGVQAGKTVSTGVTAKAERVVRTELGLARNAGNFSQMQDITARVVPEMKKRWIATADGRARESHLRVHRETREAPIPVNEPFILRTPGKPPAQLMYPNDPSGPPYEVINCRCTMVQIHPLLGVIGSSLDGRVDAELTRREAAE
jgi:hypothetical protein